MPWRGCSWAGLGSLLAVACTPTSTSGTIALAEARASTSEASSEGDRSSEAPTCPLPALRMPPGARITLRRGQCEGTCPMYEVRVDDEGRVLWRGEGGVVARGDHVGQVDPSAAARLWSQIAGLEGFEAWCRDDWRDPTRGCVLTPSQVVLDDGIAPISVEIGRRCIEGPDAGMLEAMDEIDRVLGTRRWIGERGAAYPWPPDLTEL